MNRDSTKQWVQCRVRGQEGIIGEKLDFNRINKRWNIINKYELEFKKQALIKLTDKQGINIFNRLLNFYLESDAQKDIKGLYALRRENMKEFLKMHEIFKKVK